MKRYSELKKLLEELTPEQKKLVDKYVASGTKAPEISAHIMHSDTIRIPLEEEDDDHKEPHPEVVNHLGNHGFSIPDFAHYKSGHAIDKHGRITSIGKALHKTGASEELKKTFVNDPERSTKTNSDLEVAISYHPYHVAGMSTDRGWSSCMDMDGGSNCHYLKQDIKHGTHVAYLVKKDDHEIKNPIARISIKPFTENKFNEKPYDMMTHERHKEQFAKNALSSANSDKETNHDFHDFHVSPSGAIHVIGKERKSGKYQSLKFDGFDGHLMGASYRYNTPEEAVDELKGIYAGKVIRTPDPTAHTVLRPEKSVYGTTNNAFEKTVNKWAETNFPTKHDVAYKKDKNLYSDDNIQTLRTFSDEHLKAQGENISNFYGDKSKHDSNLNNLLFDNSYSQKDAEKIYDHADAHSRANHTLEQRKEFLNLRAHSLAAGNYSNEGSTDKLVNKHLDNLREVGEIHRGRDLIHKANKQNYEAFMDSVYHGSDSKYVDPYLDSPHIRTKDIDLAIHRNSPSICDIPSNKFEKHHVEKLVETGNVHDNVVRSKHYTPELHEKLIDFHIDKFKNQINHINKIEDKDKEFVNNYFGKSIKQEVLSLAQGRIPDGAIFDTHAEKHMSKNGADKLMNFAKENNHLLKMTENNFAKIRFGTENSYDTKDLDQLKNLEHPEDMVEHIIGNNPSVEKIDKMIDNGHLKTFKNIYSNNRENWKNVFKSDKARHVYGKDLQSIPSNQINAVNGTMAAEQEFLRSIDDSHHDYIKNRNVTRAFVDSRSQRPNYSIIDKHIKNKNKLVAQTLHNIAKNEEQYKLYEETNQQRIDKIQ